MEEAGLTARSQGLVRCRSCGQLSKLPKSCPPHQHHRCPVCGASLSHRLPNALKTTWALVLTGFILYIPANLFPIMSMDLMGSTQQTTIFTGVKELFESGMWAIGLLVFCASITVPLLKLVGLAVLLWSVQRGWPGLRVQRTRLYRVIEFVGRWSMLDVFLLSILVAVVDLGALATISPEIGMVFFASVVIVTMFAANTFDPRLIWDAATNPSKDERK